MDNTQQNIGFLLIHGAGLGAWVWDEVAPQLNGSVLAVNLLGRNKIKEQRAQASLDDYVADVMTNVANWQVDKIVVVAHSLSGVIGLEVAARLGDKLAGFIAVCAATPTSGKSFVSTLPFPQKVIMPLILRLAGTRPPIAAIKSGLCNDLSDAQTAAIIEKFTPESFGVFTNPSAYGNITVPCLYIRTLKDKEYGNALQTKLAGNLPGVHIVDIDAGHMPMLSKPRELSQLINHFVSAI